MRRHITFACLFALALGVQAQEGGITPEMLTQIKGAYKHTSADKAIHNAMAGTSIAVLARNQERLANFDTNFSDKVVSHGITDQKQSGRCWLFTGLNVLARSDDGEVRTERTDVLAELLFLLRSVRESKPFPARHHRHPHEAER